MEDGDESAAAAAAAAEVEAALGLSPQLFVDEVLDIIADISAQAFEEAASVLGASTAAQKAEELQRGLNAIHHVVKGALDKRMTIWEKYCFQHCFGIPEGFIVSEDVRTLYLKDNPCSKESHKDGTSESDLDVELDSLRRKLEIAYKESENLQREISSLERQTTYKRKLDSAIAEIQKLFEDKSVQEKFEGMALYLFCPAFPEIVALLFCCCTAHAEDIQEIINILQNK
nr:unnamed protein product [Digitaria exilis]